MKNGSNGNANGNGSNGVNKNGNRTGMTEGSIIQRWAKGQTGNPNGRPKTGGFTARMREILEAGESFIDTEFELLDKRGLPTGKKARGRITIPSLEALVHVALDKAKNGDAWALEKVWDAYDGIEKNTIVNVNLGILKDNTKRQQLAKDLRQAANS